MNDPRTIGFDTLINILRERAPVNRGITAIAAPPGAGKSTIAARIAETLNTADPGSAAVLAMDGYHFDDLVLEARGDRARKGAPHTFDVAGFAAMLDRLRANAEPEIAVPVFDRSMEVARNAARVIPRSVRHLIVEGNYLLLDMKPWSDLRRMFDTTVTLDVPRDVLVARLSERWAALDPDEFEAKMRGNDLPNADLVLARSVPGEYSLANG